MTDHHVRAFHRPLLGATAALLVAAQLLHAPAIFRLLLLALLAGGLLALPAIRQRARMSRYMALPGAVVLLALALRLWGIGFGLPYLEHPDEWAVADRAVQMIQTGNFRPDAFIYPTLYTYMQAALAAAHFLQGVGAGLYQTVDQIDLRRFYVWGRTLTALVGTAAVLLTYAVGRVLYGRATGLLAALLLAVIPAAIADAHYITTDTPSMAFSVLAFLAIAHLAHAPRQPHRAALLAGLCVGLAAATKYNVAALVLPLGLALAYRAADDAAPWPRTTTQAALAVGGAALGFTLGMPYWLPALPQVLNDIASIIVHYAFTGHAGAESEQPALFYAAALWRDTGPLALVFLVGLVLACVRHRRADLLILSFAIPTMIQLSGVQVVFIRNIMPLLPFLCLLAATTLVSFWEKSAPVVLARRPAQVPWWAIPALGIALVALVPLTLSVRDGVLRARPSTRLLATEWVEQRAQPGDRIWLEDQTLLLSERVRVEGGPLITTHDMGWFRQNGFRFVVANRDVRRDDIPALEAFGTPAADFDAAGQRHGPRIVIYDTGIGNPATDERTALGASLGGGAITLDGYRHPGTVQAGGTLPLALYWQANQPLPADYVVFVHLLASDGRKLAQRDLPPLEGRVPTSGWQPGQLLRDDQDLAIPAETPPGTYQLVTGMYDAQTFAAITENGPITIGNVTVTEP